MPKAVYRCVTTTVCGKAPSTKLADAIVRAKLAACVQFWPIRSIYRWKGRIESGSEYILVCKTTLTRVTALQKFIKAHHDYEVPEIIVTPITGGHPDYLEWITKETSEAPLTFPPSPTRKSSSRSDGKP